ncbi:site-specific integrase [Alcanivorax sp. S6407]|uniref:tyrosine-type recombinase/integrase n=1 Tax=Alcanivorax sp. S6407 TaxID=2926424 RepID=UPI001FF12C0D|nr:site-specific integrase [Alcanivorax sp. S6407]MCK0153900.1 site-specific integrase [Alcanivorax sp. S6407]
MRGQYASSTWQTKAQAQAWAAEVEGEIRAGKAIGSTGRRVRDVLQRYADEVAPRNRGARRDGERISLMLSMPLADVPLEDVGNIHVIEYRDARLKKVLPATVRREMNLMGGVFRYAVEEWHWLPENPCKGVRKPPSGKARDRRISDDEIKALMAAAGYREGAQASSTPEQMALAFQLALETAMRAGEILSLEWSQIHLNEGYLTLSTTKNGDARRVPLSQRARQLLTLSAVEGGKVFSINSNQLALSFNYYREKAKLSGFTFHDTRHEAITRLAKKLDVLDLARMTGHRDLRSLQVYYNATASEIAAQLG